MSLDLIINWQPYETEFRGEKITMELLPLRNDAMLALLPFIVEDSRKKKKEAEQAMVSLEIQKVAGKILHGHIRDLQGLTINGKPPTVEQLSTEYALCPLAVDIMSELTIRSNLSRDEVKN